VATLSGASMPAERPHQPPPPAHGRGGGAALDGRALDRSAHPEAGEILALMSRHLGASHGTALGWVLPMVWYLDDVMAVGPVPPCKASWGDMRLRDKVSSRTLPCMGAVLLSSRRGACVRGRGLLLLRPCRADSLCVLTPPSDALRGGGVQLRSAAGVALRRWAEGGRGSKRAQRDLPLQARHLSPGAAWGEGCPQARYRCGPQCR
jgi:hypothetical protein